jgi:hypothetical protein
MTLHIPSHKDYLYQKALLRGYRLIPFASISGIPLVCQLYHVPLSTMHSIVEVRADPVGHRGTVD